MSAFKLFLALGLTFALLAPSASADDLGKISATKKKKAVTQTRGLASLAPDSRAMGQGEQMLRSVRSVNPRFMNGRGEKSAPVKLAGVCRDTYGVQVNSTQRGYGDCIDGQSNASGSVNEYFTAQRHAGLGILVGH